MTTLQEWLLVAGMAAATFATRYPIIALAGRSNFPKSWLTILGYIPPAVLAALVAPAILLPGGSPDFTLSNEYLLAGLAAAIVAWRTQNLLSTIALGMALFLLLRMV